MERARSRLAAKGAKTVPNRRIRQGSKTTKTEIARRRKADGPPVQGERQEILAVAFLAAAVILVLALLSYGPERENLIGRAGSFVASKLFAVFGLGAFVLPFAAFLGFIRAILPSTQRLGFFVALSYLTLVLSGGIALDLLFPFLQPFGVRPGGALGGVFADLLVSVFARVGSVILVLAIMACSLIVAAGLRLSKTFLTLGRALRWFGGKVMEFIALQIAQHRLEREARRLEEEERRAELGLPPAREKKLRFRRKKAEEGTLEAGLDGRIEAPEDFEEPEKPAKAVKPEKPARVVALPTESARADQPAETVPPTTEEAALPPDPAWVPAEEQTPVAEAPPPVQEALPAIEAPEVEAAQPAPAPAPAPASEPEPAPAAEEAAPVIELPRSARKTKKTESPFDLIVAESGFSLPPLALLDTPSEEDVRPLDEAQLHATASRLRQKLEDFGIKGQVERIRPGPVVTMYEFAPAPGVKISRIQGLSDDLAMALEALRVRIVAPIPGRGVVGIEVPNAKREVVYLRDVLEQESFRKSRSKLTLGIGKDIEGMPFVADLAKMPHLLIAGTTGSGKSVAVNSMIVSLLFKATPEEVRFIMVDPKMLELSIYEGIPHLLLPVVTDPRKAALALRWAVEEMERRYALLAENGVRDLAGYNRLVRERQKDAPPPAESASEKRKVLVIDVEKGETVEEEEEASVEVEAQEPEQKPLPYLVIIIDELADLMMVASKEVETYIARIAQKARAAGIHLMVATQRPSVDVVTGLIKANFPSRISFLLRSRTDSMTILDSNGAEKLLGQGDMLILPPTSHHLQRVHGALVTEREIKRIVDHLKAQGAPVYDESILKAPDDEESGGGAEDDLSDELYDQAVAVVSEMKRVSISMLQRKMRIGYNRSARMIERMEREGIVGPADGAKPREVLVNAPPEP